MTYPRLNGKPFDPIRKREFDKWRKLFRWTIAHVADAKGKPLDSDLLTVAAWNCAFEVVTARTDDGQSLGSTGKRAK